MTLHVGAARSGPFPRLADLAAMPFSAGAYGGDEGHLSAAMAFPSLTDLDVFPSSSRASGGERGALAAAIQGAGAYTLQGVGYFVSSVGGGGGTRHLPLEYCIRSVLRSTGYTSSDVLDLPSADYYRLSSEKSVGVLNGSQLGDNTMSLSWAHRSANKQYQQDRQNDGWYGCPKCFDPYGFCWSPHSCSKDYGFFHLGNCEEMMNGVYCSTLKSGDPTESNIAGSMGAGLALRRGLSGTSGAGGGVAAAASAAGGGAGGGAGGSCQGGGASVWTPLDNFLAELGYTSKGPLSRAFVSLTVFTIFSQGCREVSSRATELQELVESLSNPKDEPSEKMRDFLLGYLGYSADDLGWAIM